MDGPLVRFDMRAKESFNLLRQTISREKILLAGCIENIESRVINGILRDTSDGQDQQSERLQPL